MIEFLRGPVPFTKAAEWIRSKPVVSREAFYSLLPSLRARAFLISGMPAFEVAQNIRNRIAELPAGALWADVKRDVADRLIPYIVDPQADTELQDKQRMAAFRRAELLLRTNGFQAYQAASHEVMTRQADVLPYWQYLSMDDGRVRPGHAALDGLVLPADSPFWKTHYPPWEWNCRCQVVPLSQEDVARLEERDADKPEDERRVLTGARRRALETENRVLRAGRQQDVTSPAERPDADTAFVFDPEALRIPLQDLRKRYDPEVFDKFEAWAKGTQVDAGKGEVTVWDWLNGDRPSFAPRTSTSPEPEPATIPAAAATAESVRKGLAVIVEQNAAQMAGLDARIKDLTLSASAAMQRVTQIGRETNWADTPQREAAIKERDRLFAEIGVHQRAMKALRDEMTASGLKLVVQPTPAKFGVTLKSAFDAGQSKAVTDGTRIVRDLVGAGSFDAFSIEARKVRGKRSYYTGGAIHMAGSYDATIVAHEIGHWLEDVNKDFSRKAVEFRMRRTKGENLLSLRKITGNKGYKRDEMTLKDKFMDPYAGKVYVLDRHTEIISMGLQWMASDPVAFAVKDPDYFDFIYGLLRQHGGAK